jgi:hypothetical protein
VGDQTHPTHFNLFDNLCYGIYAKNSNLKSYNNTFQNTRRILLMLGSRVQLFGGVGINGINDNTHANSTNYITTITTNSPSLSPNMFFDCHIGIFATNVFELHCNYSDFRSTNNVGVTQGAFSTGQYGIIISGNRMKNQEMKYNNFRNMSTAVWVSSSPGTLSIPSAGISTFGGYMGSIVVKSNTFSGPYSPSAAISIYYMNEGVRASSFLNTTYTTGTIYETGASFVVMDNVFGKVRRGVMVNGFSNNSFTATVANNSLVLVADPNTTQQYGINLSSSTNGVVNSNTVTGFSAGTNSLVSGIYFSMNNVSSEQCNRIEKTFSAFRFEAASLGTFWRNNTILQPCPRGLHMTAGGAIGPQGSYSSPIDNSWMGSWTGTNNHTYTDLNSYAINSMLYSRTSAVYNPTNNATAGLGINQMYGAAGTLGSVNPSALFVSCSPLSTGGNNPPSINRKMAEDIVLDSLFYYDRVLETNEINKHNLYRWLDSDPTYGDSSSTLYTFHSDETGRNIGLLYTVEKNIATGDLSNAESLLTGITTASHIEENYHDLYLLMIHYLSDGYLSSSDSTTLFNLSYKCPFLDGAAVYQARALYDHVFLTNVIYTDEGCTDNGYSYRINPGSSTGNDVVYIKTDVKAVKAKARSFSLKISPNPATDELIVSSQHSLETVEILITDVNGKQLLKKRISTKGLQARVKLDLINGIYFVTLTDLKGVWSHHKLVISK